MCFPLSFFADFSSVGSESKLVFLGTLDIKSHLAKTSMHFPRNYGLSSVMLFFASYLLSKKAFVVILVVVGTL